MTSTADIPALTDKVARKIAAESRSFVRRRHMRQVREACIRAGYNPEQAERAVEDTCDLADAYRHAN